MHFFFFFNDTATTEIYTLSLHDALPISPRSRTILLDAGGAGLHLVQQMAATLRGLREQLHRHLVERRRARIGGPLDRKSTRLNSSHGYISYAVFCLKKKKTKTKHI